MKKNESYTLIVVPNHHAVVKRFHLRKDTMLRAAIAAGIALLVLAAMTAHYVGVVGDARENGQLREENLTLKTELKAIRERVRHVDATLERVERFDQKLRTLTLLSDPQRNLAMGPTEAPKESGPSASVDNQFVRATPDEKPQALRAKLDQLSAEATHHEQSLQELQAYFADRTSYLDSSPSIWPVRGWITSDFGVRSDPYTNERVMHAGLDIGGPQGKEIMSPADGTVVFAGQEGGYGNVLVIDHGYSIKTRFGHLASIGVKPGDKVKRGQIVAALGNTGRSTGPHLHYEVRVNGVAQNPYKFILEE